jgi:hypothetical protein
MKRRSESFKVGSITLPKSDSLKYLGAHFGSSITATRTLVINELKKKLRKTYGLLAKVKGQFGKYTLGKYNSMFAPHVFFLNPFWKLFSLTEKKEIRVQFYRFAKYFIVIPLWFRNSYICKKNTVSLTYLRRWKNYRLDLKTVARKCQIFRLTIFYIRWNRNLVPGLSSLL